MGARQISVPGSSRWFAGCCGPDSKVKRTLLFSSFLSDRCGTYPGSTALWSQNLHHGCIFTKQIPRKTGPCKVYAVVPLFPCGKWLQLPCMAMDMYGPRPMSLWYHLNEGMNIHTETTNHDVHHRTKIWAHSRVIPDISSIFGQRFVPERQSVQGQQWQQPHFYGYGSRIQTSEPTCLIYPLVNVYITMENHNF
jgi:hypothetical protein